VICASGHSGSNLTPALASCQAPRSQTPLLASGKVFELIRAMGATEGRNDELRRETMTSQGEGDAWAKTEGLTIRCSSGASSRLARGRAADGFQALRHARRGRGPPGRKVPSACHPRPLCDVRNLTQVGQLDRSAGRPRLPRASAASALGGTAVGPSESGSPSRLRLAAFPTDQSIKRPSASCERV
jgi:hypothetical protein